MPAITRVLRFTATAALINSLASAPVQALVIDFVFGAGLAGNPVAQAALQRGAAQWTSRLVDPMTVTVNVGFSDLGAPNIIGAASSVTLTTTNDGFDLVRDALVADAADESDDAIVAALPALAQFSAHTPPGIGLSSELAGTKANFKALGFGGLDAVFGASDGTITFNTRFAFDFDRGDGIGAGLTDLETVAAHEIGHILGFISVVDEVDFLVNHGLGGTVTVNPLDLFRFRSDETPADAAAFAATSRDLVPGDPAVFADTASALALSTGVAAGDGRQASHFKDDALLFFHLGIMDPTLAAGIGFDVTTADLRVLDLIGYEFTVVPVPVPALLFLSALFPLLGFTSRPRTH
ncbi:MAG: NF038122 family metalloprotease [Gammaproteobacteria bacterium]|nr:NF038122 family metalloprotease [Gammaproteobacteria bacterium]